MARAGITEAQRATIWALWEQGWAINPIARHGRHTWITVRGVLGAAYEPELHELAARFGLDTELIPTKSTHHAEMTELIIGRNLGWARPHV